MEEMYDLLRSRNVPEETIHQLENDKIDSSVVLLLTDDQLKQYLPSYGDRLAVIGYCRRKGNNPVGRKSILFDRLRSKMSRNKVDNHAPVPERDHNPRNAQKNWRKVEIGWKHFRGENFFQVRTKKGGGTRKLSVPKDCTKSEMIEKALDLFFPGQKNDGSITDFMIDLTDFRAHSIDDKITVGELYDQTKLPVIRFYLTTKRKDQRSCTQPRNSSEATEQEGENKEDAYSTTLSSPSPLVETEETNSTDVIYIGSSNVPLNTSSDVSLVYSSIEMTDLPVVPELDAALDVSAFDDSGTVTFLTENLSGLGDSYLDDTLPLPQESSHVTHPLTNVLHETIVEMETVKKILVLHRGQILKELIACFCDESVMRADVSVQVILPDGRLENAVDEGGVFRDVLSEFWYDFYEQCTLGNDFKVPYLRHDLGQQQWESIGRIIAVGWQKEKYLPVKLAPVILEQAALGSIKSCLTDSFLRYVSVSDRIIFESCCSDFESVNQEELLEVMDLHSCRRVPTADNIKQLLEELAHQKLIQEPAFVIEQWSNILAPMRSELEGISAAYENLQPTSRKIMRSITYPTTMDDQQKHIGKYLSTYLRESDPQHLSFFLRFCTGSDLFLGKSISISFTKMLDFERRPVAHTCGCYLELPVNYDSYPDFRHEMNKVLESNVWVMDIV